MALKYGKPNPLNLLGIRRVHFPARHFHYTILTRFNPNRTMSIEDWILQNLNGRFYIGQTLSLDSNKTYTYETKIGFEEEKELSFFLLGYSNL